MKSIKEKQLLVKWSRAMNEDIDPALVEEVERYEKLQQEIRESIRKHSISDLAEASAVAEQVVAKVLEYPKPPTLDEVLAVIKEEENELVQAQTVEESPVAEKAPLPSPTVTESELITRSAARITKEAKEARVDEDSFQQPNPALVEKNVEAIQKKLKFLEQAIGKIAATGPGGGAVNLKDLDDVSYTSVVNATNNQLLSYNAASKLWVARSVTSDGGGIALTDLSVTVDTPSGNGNLTYNENTGVFNFTPVDLSNKANIADLTTANVTELSNLYFTNARAIAALTGSGNVTIDANGVIDATLTTDRLVNGSHTVILNSNGVTQFAGNIIPTIPSGSTLGAPDNKWGEIYIGPTSLYIEDQYTANNVALTVVDGTLYIDGGQRIQIGQMAMTTRGISLVANATNQNIIIGDLNDTGYTKINNTGIEFKDNTIQITAAVRSDWNESNVSNLAYIVNKPVLVSELDDLTDVTLVGPMNDQVLSYSSNVGHWVNTNINSLTSNVTTTGYFGSFYYNGADVVMSSSTTEYIVPITGSYDGTNGVTLGANSDIIFAHTGTYEVCYSIQYENSGNADDDTSVWIKHNGVNLANTTSKFSVVRKNTGASPGSLIAVTPFMITVSAGDRVQVATACDNGHITIKNYPSESNPSIPATPAVIINVMQVASVVIPNDITGTANNASYLGGVPASSYATVANVVLKANVADLKTANVAELTNLYFTNARAVAAVTNTALSNVTISYTPATTTGYGLVVSAANTQGGTGYADFLKITNASGGATNPNKSFRLNGTGGIEVVNSDYTATIFTLTDNGTVNTGAYQVNGKQAVNGPSFSAYPTSPAQTIATASSVRVNFGNEEYDVGSCYDAPNGKFQPNVEGYYQLNATVRIDGSSGVGERMIVIYKNGSEYKRGTNESGTETGSNFFSMSVSCQAYANGSTDYFQVYVVQNSGGNRTVSEYQQISYFQGCMIRGA